MVRFSSPADGNPARTPGRHGFTLIEVLVVVAIIALLISILLPSLRLAREQGKQVRCMANLSALGKAACSYLINERDRFCWGPVTYSGNPPVPQGRPWTWYFGGNRGQSSALLGTDGWYVPGSISDWGPAERPLNRYVYGKKFNNTDARPLRKDGPLRIYECPSDQGVRWDTKSTSELHESTTGYLEVGTSYQANCSWYYYALASDGEGYSGEGFRKRILYLMDRLIPILRKKGESRAVVLYEDPSDWALNTELPTGYRVLSWHAKYDIHNLLYLDGHAAAIYVQYWKNKYSIQKAGASNWIVRQYYREEGPP